MLETQRILTKYLSEKILKPFQSIENHSQQQLQQHQDRYQHPRQHQQQYPQSQAQQRWQQSQETKIAAQKTQQSSAFRRNNPPHQNKFDILYIRNLSDDTTVGDLYELFGLDSTQYLSENSDIQLSLFGNKGKRRGFAYITVPEHVVKELLKLHGIEFNGRNLVTKKAKTPPSKTTGKNKQAFLQTQLRAIDFEMETFEPAPPNQRITGSYRNAALPKKGAFVLFSASIPKEINIKSINKQVKKVVAFTLP